MRYFSAVLCSGYIRLLKLADSSAYAAVIFSGYIRPYDKTDCNTIDVGSGNQYLPVMAAEQPITGRVLIMLHHQTKFLAVISAQVHVALECGYIR